MSVKDRLDRLEARIGETYFVFPLAPHSKMIHDLQVDMRNAEASRGDIFKRIESNADDINTLEARAQFNNAERRKLEERMDRLSVSNQNLSARSQLKATEIEVLEARVEELEYIHQYRLDRLYMMEDRIIELEAKKAIQVTEKQLAHKIRAEVKAYLMTDTIKEIMLDCYKEALNTEHYEYDDDGDPL